jgi:hypothetical protein
MRVGSEKDFFSETVQSTAGASIYLCPKKIIDNAQCTID